MVYTLADVLPDPSLYLDKGAIGLIALIVIVFLGVIVILVRGMLKGSADRDKIMVEVLGRNGDAMTATATRLASLESSNDAKHEENLRLLQWISSRMDRKE